MELETVLDKITKLTELAKNNPNSNEARLAEEKAARLIAEYNINTSQLERGFIMESDNIIFKTSKSKKNHNPFDYEVNIIILIAKNNFCNITFKRNKKYKEYNTFKLVGRKMNIKASQLMIDYIFTKLNLLLKMYKKQSDKEAFLKGFYQKLFTRLQKEKQSWGVEEQNALTVIQNQDESEIKTFLKDNYKKLRQVDLHGIKSTQDNYAAMSHGIKIANNLYLGKQVTQEKSQLMIE